MVTTIPPAMVDFVLKQPIDPNVRDAAGNTALHLAGSTTTSGHEYLKLVASLLQHGASAILSTLPGNLATARTKFCEALSLLIAAGSPVDFSLPPPRVPCRTPIPPTTFLEWAVAEMQDTGLLRAILAAYAPPSDTLRVNLPRALCMARSVDVARLLLSAGGPLPLEGPCITHLLKLGLAGLSHELLSAAADRLDTDSPAAARAFVTNALSGLLPPPDLAAILKRAILAREIPLLQWLLERLPSKRVADAAVRPGLRAAWLRTVTGQDRRLKSSVCPAVSSVTELAVDAWLVTAGELSWPPLNANASSPACHMLQRPLRAIELLTAAGVQFDRSTFDSCMQRLVHAVPQGLRPRQPLPTLAQRASYKTIYLAAAGLQCWTPQDHPLHPGPLKAAVATLVLANGTQWRRDQPAADAAHAETLPALPSDVLLLLVRALAQEPSAWLHLQAPLRLQRPSEGERVPVRAGGARGVPPYFYSI